MPTIRRVLAPTDFSPASDIAFRYALHLAAREGAAIHLLHVVEEPIAAGSYPDGFYTYAPALRAQVIDEAIARLNTVLGSCAIAGVETTTEVLVGKPARVIADVARERGTDLIVMGTHGRTGFAHLMLGSVAERVVRIAPCAVLTVPQTSRTADQVAIEATHPTVVPT